MLNNRDKVVLSLLLLFDTNLLYSCGSALIKNIDPSTDRYAFWFCFLSVLFSVVSVADSIMYWVASDNEQVRQLNIKWQWAKMA